MTVNSNITRLLKDAQNGDDAALNDLFPLVYDELRKLASVRMNSERANHTLQPTALVHEVYMRLIDQHSVDWQNRLHFFGLVDFVELDEALNELEKFAPRQAKVVEMRFFGGLTNEEVAEFLKLDERTIKRDWRTAKAWLFEKLKAN
jgi:RNA polymerase sigma-70 factor, ECF subfamily